MSDAYVGEIRLVAFAKTPSNFVPCDGKLLSTFQYSELFLLLGTTYGGDGVQTFGVPDLRGRTPIHYGNGPEGPSYDLAETAGVNAVTLSSSQTPVHRHTVQVSTDSATATQPVAGMNLGYAATTGQPTLYADPAAQGALIEPLYNQAVSMAGGNAPHTNIQPSIGLQYVIATNGIFPTSG